MMASIANATVDGTQIGELEAMSYYIIIATVYDTTSPVRWGSPSFSISSRRVKKLIDDP